MFLAGSQNYSNTIETAGVHLTPERILLTDNPNKMRAERNPPFCEVLLSPSGLDSFRSINYILTELISPFSHFIRVF